MLTGRFNLYKHTLGQFVVSSWKGPRRNTTLISHQKLGHMLQGSEGPQPKKNISCSGEPKKFIGSQPLGCRILALGRGKLRNGY